MFVVAGLILACLTAIGFLIANYITASLAYYSIARRKGVRGAWLAWIPLGRDWIQGRITDKCNEAVGTKKRWAITLVVISLIGYLALALYVGGVKSFIEFMADANEYRYGYDFYTYGTTNVISLYFYAALMAAVSAGLNILRRICQYKIYEAIVPQKCIKYMVLTVFVPLASGICLLLTKSALKDETNTLTFDGAHEEAASLAEGEEESVNGN